jgi:dihydropyrimidinase
VPIMIVHVSGRQAMKQIRWAQQRGLQVYGETCPQYVALTAEDLKGLNMDESGDSTIDSNVAAICVRGSHYGAPRGS